MSKYHCSRWFFNGFFTCEPLVSMVFQWFFRFQPLVSMVFPMVFSNPTIAIEWMVLWLTIDIDGLSMVLGKFKAGSQKGLKTNKTWFVQQIPRGKQSLDMTNLAQCTGKIHEYYNIYGFDCWFSQHIIIGFVIITIATCKLFLYSPLPLNEWMENHHWYQWFYDGFWSKNDC